ncbi:MAG: hypothetical protein J6S84_00725 [Bacteroidales bacterium]|nr:hypothetical protein [Bacteroidales bacterium]
MKNFKIVMILVAAVAMFCSCGDPDAPTVTVTGDVTEYDLATPEKAVTLTVNATAPKGIENVYGDVWGIKQNDTVALGELTVEDFTAGDSYNGTIKYTLKKEAVKNYEKVLFQVVAVTKKEVEAAGHFTVTIKAAVAEANFKWTKVGTPNPDLSAYGLLWDGNHAKAIYAEIKPLNANAKLYELTPADYNKASIAEINFPADPTQKYKKILADKTGETTYDNVIASVYEGKTYVFHITKGTSSYDATTGTTLIIEGTYKTFETTPAVVGK